MTRFDPAGRCAARSRRRRTSRSPTARRSSRRWATARRIVRGLPRRRRHALDPRRGRGARRARSPASRRDAGLDPDRGRRAARRRAPATDRRRQRGHPAAPAAGLARGAAGGRVDARRRRVDPPPAGRPRRRAAAPRWARRSSAATAAWRRCASAAPRCTGSSTGCRSRAPRSSPACCWRASLADGQTTVIEPARPATTPSACCGRPERRCGRERGDAGDDPRRAAGAAVTVEPAERLEPVAIDVPGDFSSAAFFIVAARSSRGSEVRLRGRRHQSDRIGLLGDPHPDGGAGSR